MGVGLNAGLGALAQVVGQELDPNAQLRRISPVLALVKDMEQRQVVEQQMAQRAFQLQQQMDAAERAEKDRKALEDYKAKQVATVQPFTDGGMFGPMSQKQQFITDTQGLPAEAFVNTFLNNVVIADRQAEAARQAADEAMKRRIAEQAATTEPPLTLDELAAYDVPQDLAAALALQPRAKQVATVVKLMTPKPEGGPTVDQSTKLDRLQRLDTRAQTLTPYLSGDRREGLIAKLNNAASAANWDKPEVQSAISGELDKIFGGGAGDAFVAGLVKDRTGQGGTVKASTAPTNVAAIRFIPWNGSFKSITELKPLVNKAQADYAAQLKALGMKAEDVGPPPLPEPSAGVAQPSPEDVEIMKRLDAVLPGLLKAAGQ